MFRFDVFFDLLCDIFVWLVPSWRLLDTLGGAGNQVGATRLAADLVISGELHPQLVFLLLPLPVKSMHPTVQPEPRIVQKSAHTASHELQHSFHALSVYSYQLNYRLVWFIEQAIRALFVW